MRIPLATYRLQFNRDFTFADAAAIAEYLADLGITDLYASPIFAARSGSTHGYDVVEHSEINTELGGEEGLARLGAELRRRELGMLLDIVPNHMCIAGDLNRRWLDVLENGPASSQARFFDIDWRPPKPELANRVLLPVLGEQYGRMLEDGITVGYQDGGFVLCFYETKLPMAPRSHPHVLIPALAELRRRLGDEEPRVLELESINRAIGYLPLRTETSPAKLREREHEKAIIRRRLAALMSDSSEVREAVEHALRELNGRKGDPRSFDRLEALVADQPYRLSQWRVAAHEINYRRFFDINDLAAIRVEDPVVFAAVHALPLRLARDGIVSGFRIDHVDGLFDPEKYLNDLQRGFRESVGARAEDGRACYVVVEKILAPGERLPSEWPTEGTTGYEFLNLVGSVLTDAAAGNRLREAFATFRGDAERFSDIAYVSKRVVLRTAMASEMTVLARRLDHISEQHRYTRDFTLNSLQEVLREVVACFPVYRTYIRPGDALVSERDRLPIDVAIRQAKRRNPVISETMFDFVRSVLLLEHPEGLTEAERAERQEFVLKFQQLTGPVMAKGVEDTAFYRYFPLTALSEVGGDPDAFGVSIEEFHRRNAERMVLTRHGLSATATHDTKRGEDTRTRLYVLSEVTDRWTAALARFRELNETHRSEVGGVLAPDRDEEYLYYQTLIGAWPFGETDPSPEFVERIQQYILKAMLEGKVHTSWVNRNEAHEQAVRSFIAATLDPGRSGPFLQELALFREPIARAGVWNSLSQVLLKVASPGIPDFYQGCELWDFSLVDPDNRRPVDYAARRSALAALRKEGDATLARTAERLLRAPEDGQVKLFVTARALKFRRSDRALFDGGGYEPIAASGTAHDHIVAFARAHEGRAVIAVVGRHFARLGAELPIGAAWGDAKLVLPETLARRRYREVLTDRPLRLPPGGDARALPLEEVLAHLPVALVEVT